MGTVGISVCFAARGRPESLAGTVTQLLGLADCPEDIEVLIAMDPDDPARPVAEGIFASQPDTQNVRIWTAPERYGYTGLHHYLNALAKQARGAWIMWWNDDMVMQTEGWDSIVIDSPQGVLWPHANHVGHANIAPIWPKAWSDANGYVTATTHMDTWLQYVAEQLGCHHKVPIEIIHDRADVTGNHDDETYAEGRKLLGPEGMAPDFQQALEKMPAYVETVRKLL
jgi:hypothetical protein